MNRSRVPWGAKIGAQFGVLFAVISIVARSGKRPDGWMQMVPLPLVGSWQFFGFLFAGIIVGTLYRLTYTAVGAALVGFCAALPLSSGYFILKYGAIGNSILVSGGTPWSHVEWVDLLVFALLCGGGIAVTFYYETAGRRKAREARWNERGGAG